MGINQLILDPKIYIHINYLIFQTLGSENMNPFEVMKSKQWKKAPTSLMFIELFKYISGVNKVKSQS